MKVRVAGMSGRAAPAPHVVKSAARVLEIFELFDDLRRELAVGEIAALLRFPQSSTSGLLYSLVELGFLRYDPGHRTFSPTQRVALLGNWLPSPLAPQAEVLKVMQAISLRARSVVFLATRCGFNVRDISIVDAARSAAPITRMDKIRPLLTSGTGHALLSLYPDAELDPLLRRMIAERRDGDAGIDKRFVLSSIRDTRRRGYCAAPGWVTKGMGALVVPMPQLGADQPMALGIRLTCEQLNRRLDSYLAILREETLRLAADPAPPARSCA